MASNLKRSTKQMKRSNLARKVGLSGSKPKGKDSGPKVAQKAKGRSKRAKLPTRSRLIKDLDSLQSRIIRLRDGCCVLCGSTERLQNGHIFGRRSHGARFDIAANGNAHCQCAGCNIKHNQRPWIYYKWYIDKFGQDSFDEMYRRWERGRQFKRPELMEMRTAYQRLLASMENGNGA